MWRNELAGCLAFRLVAQTCQDVAFGIIETDTWANTVGRRIGGDGHAEFAYIGDLCRLVDIQSAGPSRIDPLGFKFAVGVKHLDTVILPVSNVDPAR